MLMHEEFPSLAIVSVASWSRWHWAALFTRVPCRKLAGAPLIHQRTEREWWGDFAGRALQTVQWHGDTLDPPAGAAKIAGGVHRSNQAFVVSGMHLLMQSHLEMTPALVRLTVECDGAQLRQQNVFGNLATSVYDDVLNNLPERTASMHMQLEQLYVRWMQSCD